MLPVVSASSIMKDRSPVRMLKICVDAWFERSRRTEASIVIVVVLPHQTVKNDITWYTI